MTNTRPARERRVASATIPKEIAMESSHVSALQSKHAGLEARLRDEMNRPAPDATTIQKLKKQKLRLKEEMSQH
jgi:hypothetical protein